MGRLTGLRGLAICYLYMALGYGTLRAVTPDFGRISSDELYKEGRFRAVHARLRAHAESVAFFGGGLKEGQTITTYFQQLVQHVSHATSLKWGHGVADEFFSRQLPHNITWLLTLMFAKDFQVRPLHDIISMW